MNAPEIEVLSGDALFSVPFQCLEENSPNWRSHQVQRISALRDRFRAAWPKRRCS